MYVTIPMDKKLLEEMLEGDYDVLNAKEKIETHIRYFLDCDVYEGLPTMSNYESFKMDFEKSVKLEGLVSDKELQKVKDLAEDSTIFKIMNIQHAAAYYFESGQEDWEDRLDDRNNGSKWFITIYLHKEETEDFIKENIRIFL